MLIHHGDTEARRSELGENEKMRDERNRDISMTI